MWRLFNIVEATPINVIIFVLFMIVCFIIGMAGGYFTSEDYKGEDWKAHTHKCAIIGGFLGLGFFLFLMWLFLGPRTFIGAWLMGN